ncbi:cob(I)alamin adenosyltransferase [Acetivibrio straminisolvens JCM 21531]|uniref:Cob(I)alamin adenosyltransferase n=2 Tax=Acetivibrio straminisolvens TaxID=253314 RepID=W4V2X6_9FIRM|nr:cob(I)alamin adenosyltransferase [Acetivibrio straminisolvens JCM 21531]
MVQFLKSQDTGELKVLEKLEPGFKVFRFEKKHGFIFNMSEEEIAELKKEVKAAFDFVKTVLFKRECDILILDEIMAAMNNGLIDVGDVAEVLKNKPSDVEMILTGRDAPDKILELADYVSHNVCKKHPFERGIGARKGIEY